MQPETITRIKVNSKIYKFLRRTDRVLALYGGAGAGKSYAVAQVLCLKFLSEKGRYFLITRKTNPALRISAYSLILQMLNDWGIAYKHNKTEQTIQLGTNIMFFKSLDDKEKIKSAEFNYAWMEEATEFDYEDYLQIKLRLRRATTKPNQLFLTFNPVMVPWIEKEIQSIPALKVTYKDNVFLSEDYIRSLEELKNKDETYYQIYALGNFAQVEGLIYRNWQEYNSDIDWTDSWYGIDFGFNNPTAIVEVTGNSDILYIRERLYQTHLTNSQLIDRMQSLGIERYKPIYCDSAEPDRIREIQQAGYNAIPAKKDVRNGIDFVKRFKLMVDGPHLIDELKTYKWRENKDGRVDDPVKFKDHLMDAMRYAVYTHLKTPKAKGGKIDI